MNRGSGLMFGKVARVRQLRNKVNEMITGIGTDLVEIARVQKAIGRSAFLERVYTERERELIAVRSVRAAGNFAAKEAVAKALGCGFAGIAPAEIEILRQPSGLPFVVLHGRARERAKLQGISNIQISITDTAEYAQAYAICEGAGAEAPEGTAVEGNRNPVLSGKRRSISEAALPVLDAAGMKEADRITIEEVGISPLVLMERAALAVAECVKKYATEKSRIGVLCGTGNNGGDGVAAARLLYGEGYAAEILLKDASLYQSKPTESAVQDRPEKGASLHGTAEFLQQLKIAEAWGVPVCEPSDTARYDIIVDALFGIGLSKPVEGEYAALLERMNRESHIVIAVDIASGISASTGKVCGTALQANETVTFGGVKCGHLLYPGKKYTGRLNVAGIGFPEAVLRRQRQGIWIGARQAEELFPERPAYSNKGTFGRVAVVAGSKNMAGAAYFAACAAYRTGAGLVKIVTCECNREVLQSLLPEAMLATYAEDGELPQIVEETLQFADAVVIGPGLGQGETAECLVSMLREALCKEKEAAPPSVWDADALNLIARKMQREGVGAGEERIAFLNSLLPERAVLTPHPGELSRLLGKPVPELTDSLFETAKRISSQSELTYVLKDAVTLVTNHSTCFFNTTGNSGMATGGSGDILCGVIAALLAGGMDCFTAAAMGVWFHGGAGDAAEKETGAVSMIARDILRAIGELLKEKGKEVVK